MALRVVIGLALVAMSVAVVPAAAGVGAADLAAAERAEQRAERMWWYDRAAWRGTDAFMATVQAKGLDLAALLQGGEAGYVVEPGKGKALTVTFFVARGGVARAIAVFGYDPASDAAQGDMTPGGATLGGGQPLTALGLRMVAAQQAMWQRMGTPGHGVCSRDRPNTLILPEADGGLSAYVMSASRDWSRYPMGGHYRFDFAADGHLVAERAFTRGCLNMDVNQTGAKALGVTHVMDPAPTEIHAFISRQLGALKHLDLMVATTPNGEMWIWHDGRLNDHRPLPPAAADAAPPAKPS
ncbi:hypothetical protein GTZ99_02875 [Novosphingobium sp. FSY-8]|uniref:Uncharacterized protein n=1 Tax=Novosphingobium ovatum TaxID=1908523 RepID=A0ABW9XAD8_9SPHN|nr:hypothetical protein [Novosphingobium ovatum]NBC35495.1 hypothetical protein [Novosphingobium ovatum]